MSTLGIALVMREARRAATERLHTLHLVACRRAGMTDAEAEQSYRDDCAREREAVEQIERLIAEHGRTAPVGLWKAPRARAAGIPVEEVGGGQ